MLEGMHYGWSSPSLPQLLVQSNGTARATEREALLVAQMFVYGSMSSTAASVVNYPHLQQRATLVLSILVMALSWALIAAAGSAVHLLMAARFLAGVGRFLVYLVSTDYICEIAEPRIRGALASAVYVMMNLGLLVVYSVGPSVGVAHFALLGGLVSLAELAVVRWVPESPYALASAGHLQKARAVLKGLRGRWDVEYELEGIAAAVRRQEDENGRYWDWWLVASNRRAVLILSSLHAFQLLSGVNISIHHVLKPGGGDCDSYYLAIVTSATGVVACTISALLLDHVGRKPVLIASFLLSGVVVFAYGTYVYLEQVLLLDVGPWRVFPLACLVLYTMVYRMGVGMVPLLISGEIFPMGVKNVSAAYCGIFTIIVSFLSIASVSFVRTHYGEHILFWCYSGICILGTLFTYKFVPETKGLSLEEIQWKLK